MVWKFNKITLFDQLTDETFKDMRAFSSAVMYLLTSKSCLRINRKKENFNEFSRILKEIFKISGVFQAAVGQ